MVEAWQRYLISCSRRFDQPWSTLKAGKKGSVIGGHVTNVARYHAMLIQWATVGLFTGLISGYNVGWQIDSPIMMQIIYEKQM
jgi:fluoride ion exporter CrcB/FEX